MSLLFSSHSGWDISYVSFRMDEWQQRRIPLDSLSTGAQREMEEKIA